MRVIVEYAIVMALVAAAGCAGGPSRIEVPEFDPNQIAARAIEMYDKDGDGNLSVAEQGDVKSLESAAKRLDVDGDSKLTAAEIAARIESYHQFKAALLPVSCTITQAGRPISGAKVVYEPEQFMGEHALPAYGTTNSLGIAIMSMAEEHLPSPNLTGVQPGFYRIRIILANGREVTKLNAGTECAGDEMNNHTFAIP